MQKQDLQGWEVVLLELFRGQKMAFPFVVHC